MSITAEKQRKSIRDLLGLGRVVRGGDHSDHLRALRDDVVITSPKVYESGLITNLDLRLVDLYADCEPEGSNASVSAPGGDASPEIAWW